MKRLFAPLGIVLALSLTAPASGLAADAASCRSAWSAAFDAITLHQTETAPDSLAVFLTQNDVAAPDAWAGYRAVTARYRCYLNSICAQIESGGNAADLTAQLSPANALGGALPGETALCFPEATMGEILSPLKTEYAAALDLAACTFSTPGTPDEEREIRYKMYADCTAHAEVMSEVYDRTVRNLLLADSERKTSGYFAAQVTEIVQGIESLQEVAGKFVSHFNSVMGRICTLSSPD